MSTRFIPAAVIRNAFAAALVLLAAMIFAQAGGQQGQHGAPIVLGAILLEPEAPGGNLTRATFQWRAPDARAGQITGYRIQRQTAGPLSLDSDPILCESATYGNDGAPLTVDANTYTLAVPRLFSGPSNQGRCYRWVISALNSANQPGAAATTRSAFPRRDTTQGCAAGTPDRVWGGPSTHDGHDLGRVNNKSPRAAGIIQDAGDNRWGYQTHCASPRHLEGGDWCHRLNYAHGDVGLDLNARAIYYESGNRLTVPGQNGERYYYHCYIEGLDSQLGKWENFIELNGYNICYSRLNNRSNPNLGNRLGTDLHYALYRDVRLFGGWERDHVCALNEPVDDRGYPTYSACQGFAEYSPQHRSCQCRGLSENITRGADDKWNCSCNIAGADPRRLPGFECACPEGAVYNPDRNACLPAVTAPSNPAFFASEDLRRFDVAPAVSGAPILVGAVEMNQSTNRHIVRWRPPQKDNRGGGRIVGYDIVTYSSKFTLPLSFDPGVCDYNYGNYNAGVTRVGPEVFSLEGVGEDGRCNFFEIYAVNGQGRGAAARSNTFFHRLPENCPAGQAKIWGGTESSFSDWRLVNFNPLVDPAADKGYDPTCRSINLLEDTEWCNRLNYSYGTAGHKINARYGLGGRLGANRVFCHIEGANTSIWERYDGTQGKGGRNYCADRNFAKVTDFSGNRDYRDGDGCHRLKTSPNASCPSVVNIDHDFQCNMRPTDHPTNSEGEFTGTLCGAFAEYSPTHRRCECRGLATGLNLIGSAVNGTWSCGCDVAGANTEGGACACPAGTTYHPDENACLTVGNVNRLADSTRLIVPPANQNMPALPVSLRLEVMADAYPGRGEFDVFFADAPRPLLGCENVALTAAGPRTRAGSCVARDGFPQGVSTLAATYSIPHPAYRADPQPAIAMLTVAGNRQRDCEDANPLVNPVGGTMYMSSHNRAGPGDFCALEDRFFAADNGQRICDWNPNSVHPVCPELFAELRNNRCVEHGALFKRFDFVGGQSDFGCVCDDNTPVPCGLNALLLAEIQKNNPIPSVISSLVAAGANVNGTDANNDAFLFIAARRGHANIVRTLMENGADPGRRQGFVDQSFAHFMANKNETAPGLAWEQAVVVLKAFGDASDAAEVQFALNPFEWNVRNQVGTLALDYLETAFNRASGNVLEARDLPDILEMGDYLRFRGSECLVARPGSPICDGEAEVRCETVDPRVNPAGGNWFENRRCDFSVGENGAFAVRVGDPGIPPSCAASTLRADAGDNICDAMYQRMREAACLENPVLQFKTGSLKQSQTDYECVCRDGGAPPNCGKTGLLLAEIRTTVSAGPNTVSIIALINDGADVNGEDAEGVGFLYIAATLGLPRVVRTLMDNDIDPNRRFDPVDNLTFPHFLADKNNRLPRVTWSQAATMLIFFGEALDRSRKTFDWNARDNNWLRAMDYLPSRQTLNTVSPGDNTKVNAIQDMAHHMILQGAACSNHAGADYPANFATCVGTDKWRCESVNPLINPAGGTWHGGDERCDFAHGDGEDDAFAEMSANGAPSCVLPNNANAATRNVCEPFYAQLRQAACLDDYRLRFKSGGPGPNDNDLGCICDNGGFLPCDASGLLNAELEKAEPSISSIRSLVNNDGANINGVSPDGFPYFYVAAANGHIAAMTVMINELGANHAATFTLAHGHAGNFSHFIGLKDGVAPNISWGQAGSVLFAFGAALESADKSFDWTALDSGNFRSLDHLRFRHNNETITPGDASRDSAIQSMAHYLLVRDVACTSHHDSPVCAGTPQWRCENVNPRANPAGGSFDTAGQCTISRSAFHTFASGIQHFICQTRNPGVQCDEVYAQMRAANCLSDSDYAFKIYNGGGNADYSCVCAAGGGDPPCGRTEELLAEIRKPNPSLAAVSAHIQNGANVDGIPDGLGFLFVAASLGHAEVVRTLIENGADINRLHMFPDGQRLDVPHFLALKEGTAPDITWAEAAGVFTAFGDALEAAGASYDWNALVGNPAVGQFPLLAHLRHRHVNDVSPSDDTRLASIESMAHYAILRGATCHGAAVDHPVCQGTDEWRCENVNPLINPQGGEWEVTEVELEGGGARREMRCIFRESITSRGRLFCHTWDDPSNVDPALNHCDEVYPQLVENACVAGGFLFTGGSSARDGTDLSCACAGENAVGVPPFCDANGLLFREIEKENPSIVSIVAHINDGASPGGPEGGVGLLFVAASLGHANVVRALVENGADPERRYASPGGRTVTLNLAHFLAGRDLYAPDSLTWAEAAEVLAAFADAVDLTEGAEFDWNALDGEADGNEKAIDYLPARFNDENVTRGDVTRRSGIQAMAHTMLERGAVCETFRDHTVCRGTNEWRCESAHDFRVHPERVGGNPLRGGEWDEAARRCDINSPLLRNVQAADNREDVSYHPAGLVCWAGTTPTGVTNWNECDTLYMELREDRSPGLTQQACYENPDYLFTQGGRDLNGTNLNCICNGSGAAPDPDTGECASSTWDDLLLEELRQASPNPVSVRRYLEEGANPNRVIDGVPLLVTAAASGVAEVVAVMLTTRGVNAAANITASDGGNVAHLAARGAAGASWTQAQAVLMAFGDIVAGENLAFDWNAEDAAGRRPLEYLPSSYALAESDAERNVIVWMTEYLLGLGAAECRPGSSDSAHIACLGTVAWRCQTKNAEINPVGGEWDRETNRCALNSDGFYSVGGVGAACWTVAPGDVQRPNDCNVIFTALRAAACLEDPGTIHTRGGETALDTNLSCVCRRNGLPPDATIGCDTDALDARLLAELESDEPNAVSVRAYLEQGADPSVEVNGVPLLVTAAATGDPEIVAAMLTVGGANVTASVVAPDGGNVAHMAARGRAGESWAEARRVLTVFGGIVGTRERGVQKFSFYWNAEDSAGFRPLEYMPASYARAQNEADRAEVMAMANYMIVRGAGCRRATVGESAANHITCLGDVEDLSELQKLCRDTLTGDLNSGGGVADMVCSNVNLADTFCILGSEDAFPCRGLLRHVRKCNYEYNRVAHNISLCGVKCPDGALASGAYCCTAESVFRGECNPAGAPAGTN